MLHTTFDRHDADRGCFTEVLAMLLAAMTSAVFLLLHFPLR